MLSRSRCGGQSMLLGECLRDVGEGQEEGEVALEVLGNQEVFFYVQVSLFTETRGDFRVGKEKTDLIRGAFDGVGEQSGVLVNHLRRNAADG
jgi:hypothetical protein